MIPILHDSNITNRPHICHIILPNQIEILNCLVKLRYSNIVYTHLVKRFLFAALANILAATGFQKFCQKLRFVKTIQSSQ